MDSEQYSTFYWAKVVVGALLATNFALPLYTVVSNQNLWDEPMAVLAGSLSCTCMMLGISSILVGIYDLTQLNIDSVCALLLYNSASLFIASKAAHVCMAIDQFMAIIRPLHYYQTMMPARLWFTGIICAAWVANFTTGILAIIFDLETFAEVTIEDSNVTQVYYGCRGESALADKVVIAEEVQILTLSLATAGLLVYTGVVGYRTAARLTQERRNRAHDLGHQRFLNNYRAFKKIVIVLSLTVTLDIVGPTVRVATRWYPMPRLVGFLMRLRFLAIIVEGWVYGLSNVKLRAAYRRTLCGRSNRVETVSGGANEAATRGQRLIFSIVCGSSIKKDEGQAAQEAPIIRPDIPSIPGAGSNGEDCLEVDEAKVSQSQPETQMATDKRDEHMTQEEYQRGRQEVSIDSDVSMNEEDNQEAIQRQTAKKRLAIVPPDIVITSFE